MLKNPQKKKVKTKIIKKKIKIKQLNVNLFNLKNSQKTDPEENFLQIFYKIGK